MHKPSPTSLKDPRPPTLLPLPRPPGRLPQSPCSAPQLPMHIPFLICWALTEPPFTACSQHLPAFQPSRAPGPSLLMASAHGSTARDVALLRSDPRREQPASGTKRRCSLPGTTAPAASDGPHLAPWAAALSRCQALRWHSPTPLMPALTQRAARSSAPGHCPHRVGDPTCEPACSHICERVLVCTHKCACECVYCCACRSARVRVSEQRGQARLYVHARAVCHGVAAEITQSPVAQ